MKETASSPGKEDVMTGPALAIRAINGIRRSDESFFESYFRKTGLKERQVFCLFSAAVKDDETLIDEIVEILYAEMKAFDRERADDTIEIVVDRDPSAAARFRALLKDMWTRSATRRALRAKFA
jgi:cobalamin biosynthesis protein CbiG